MASTIIIKNGTGSAVPSSLTQGELAINVDNGALFYGTSGSSNAVSSSFIFTELSASNIVTHLNITASGHISTSGNIISDKVHTNVVAGKVDGSGIVLGSSTDIHVTASGNISASGTITALSMSGDGSELTNVSATLPSGVISSSLQDLGNITGSNITLDGNSFTMANATTPTIRLKDTTNNYFVDLKMANSFGIEVDGNANSDFYIATNEYNGTTATTTALFMDGGDGRLSLNDQAVSIDVAGNISASGTVSASILHAASGQLIGDVAASTGLLVTGEISGSQISSSGNISATGNLTVGGDLTVNGDTVTFESANTNDPQVTIKNTTDGTNDAAQLFFVKDRGAAPAIGTNLGEVRFVGEDSAQNSQEYGGFLCEIDVATNGQESGQFGIFVATHDGELQTGFQLTGGSAEDEIDVTLGLGADSVTTVNGNLNITSNITASGKIVDSTFSSDNLLNLHDDNVVNANGVTLSSIGSMVIMLDSNNTGTVDKLEFRADSQDASAGNLLATIEDNGDFSAEGNINTTGNINVTGSVSASNFIGAPIQIVTHAWYSNTTAKFPNGDLTHLINGNSNFGWADRAWNDSVTKSELSDNQMNGTNDHNKGVPIQHNVTDIQLTGFMRASDATNRTEMNYYLYKGTPTKAGSGPTVTFLASASSAAANTTVFEEIYITGSTGLQADAGDHIYVFANTDGGAGNIRGMYTVTAKIRE